MHYFWSFLDRSDNDSVRFGLSIFEKFGKNCIVGTLLACLTNDLLDVGVSQFSHFLRYSASREQNFYISFVIREACRRRRSVAMIELSAVRRKVTYPNLV